MLYCSRNCQLKSNTWNTEARLKTASPLRPETGRSPAPQRPPENVFLSIFFFFPPFTPSLFVKSCRQCTFTSAYTAHKSPKPDVLLNVLIKPISSVERVARLQCKPARGHACEKENNNESLQHPVHTAAVPPHPTHTCSDRSRPVPVPDVSHAQVCFPPPKRETDQTQQIERKYVFHILRWLLQNTN